MARSFEWRKLPPVELGQRHAWLADATRINAKDRPLLAKNGFQPEILEFWRADLLAQ